MDTNSRSRSKEAKATKATKVTKEVKATKEAKAQRLLQAKVIKHRIKVLSQLIQSKIAQLLRMIKTVKVHSLGRRKR
jgi:hypothetical protein